METRKITLLTCLTVLGVLLAGCAPATPPAAPKPAAPAAAPTTPAAKPAAPAATPKAAGEQPRYGGILTIANGGEPPSLDIHREETTFTTSITSGTYNGIVKYDPAAWPESKVVADLATSWEASGDGKVYTFRMAKGVKWHDGAPFTAEDAKYTIDRIRDPKLGVTVSPRRQWFDTDVVSMDTPDESTLKITLKSPKASFLSLLAAEYNKVLPKHVATQKDMRNVIVGTGPFKFKEYTSGVSWELVKNPDYFVKGRPYLDGVKSYIILDSFTRFAALRTKSVLWMAPFPYMSAGQTKVIEEQLSDKIALAWGFHPAWYGVIFNLTKSPWSDVRVRQAVTLTFDRKKMVAIGVEGAGVVAMAAQPPGEYTLPEEEMKKVPGYEKPDLEAARKLMAEAGLANGFKAEAVVRGVKPHQDMGILAKDAMAQIGITLDFKVVETGVYKDLIFRKAFDVNPLGWGVAVTDPDVSLGDYYVTGSSRNAGGYSNPRYDEMFAKQSATLDKAERRKIVWEMQRILLKDVPIALAYWVNVPYAWWKEVKGFKPPVSFINAFGGYPDMWIAK